VEASLVPATPHNGLSRLEVPPMFLWLALPDTISRKSLDGDIRRLMAAAANEGAHLAEMNRQALRGHRAARHVIIPACS